MLPDVIAGLLPPDTDVPASITVAAAGGDADEQIEALNADLDTAADTLEEIADQITEEPDQEPNEVPEPVAYGDAAIDKLNQRFTRIDLAWDKLRTTRTGRLILRNTGNAAATVASGVGLAATDVVSGGTASMIAMVGGWLYTRIRRWRPDLPPRNRV